LGWLRFFDKKINSDWMIVLRTMVAVVSASIGIFFLSSHRPATQGSGRAPIGIPSDSIVSLVEKAYVYGYPLMLMHATKAATTNFPEPVPNKAAAPVNQFGHFRTFPDADFKEIVRPNCDTYYSSAWLDLKSEPMVLTVPNTNGRYYLMPMLDAYTNVFSSPGKRTTGTQAGNFLITGPGYKGVIPQGMTQIMAPTNMVWILGRTQTNSKEDGATIVKDIQDGYRLTPLSKWGTAYKPDRQPVDNTIPKVPAPVLIEKMDIEKFINKLNALMIDNPPAAQDAPLLTKLNLVDVGAGRSFSLANYDAETQTKLKAIPEVVHQKLRLTASKTGQLENGWNVTRTGLGVYGTNYLARALIALVGLGANLNVDASYPNCQMDEAGEKLHGANRYIIHFEKGQLPPVNAFWSITLYGPDDLLVANSINRYAVGDRDQLKYNKDGSLDIYIQQENPGKKKEANWLPAGKEGFSLTMRLYWPKDSFMNGSWKVPGVRKIK
jgi:DNA sulfur modification protein DndE